MKSTTPPAISQESQDLAAIPRDVEEFRQNTRRLIAVALSVLVEKLDSMARCGFWLDDRTRQRVESAFGQIQADLKSAPMVMHQDVREEAIAQIRVKHARLDPAVQLLIAGACKPARKQGGRQSSRSK